MIATIPRKWGSFGATNNAKKFQAMLNRHTFLLWITLALPFGLSAQKQSTMEKTNNPLLCDPEVGICGVPDSATVKKDLPENSSKTIKVIYFTDPICSSCWGIEPQLRKLKLEYGKHVEIEYRMGGLLPDWSYNSGGISKPSDVAHHWDEVSAYYDMPIDGDVWLEDPLHSSYPPSIAFKAAQMQDPIKAQTFMREIREMVFLHKTNIAKWENLAVAAEKTGLDVAQLKADFDGPAKKSFEEDLALARQLGVRGFPTLLFTDSTGQREVIYGSKPYPFFETAVLKLDEKAEKVNFDKDWKSLFTIYPSLTAREFAELSGIARSESSKVLNTLVEQGELNYLSTKNGGIWTRVSDKK